MRMIDWSSDVCYSYLSMIRILLYVAIAAAAAMASTAQAQPAGSPVDAPRPAAAGKPAATSPASTYRINAGDELEAIGNAMWRERVRVTVSLSASCASINKKTTYKVNHTT